MQSVGITASRHDTSGKLIDDQNLIVFYHIILIPEHQVVGTQRKNDIVLDLHVLRIGKVFNVEEFLYFMNTLFRQGYNLIFFVDNKVSGVDFPLCPEMISGVRASSIRTESTSSMIQ